MVRQPAHRPLFPYTTLFRSRPGDVEGGAVLAHQEAELLGPPCEIGEVGPGEREPEGALRRIDLERDPPPARVGDRKSTRLNSSHVEMSYAVLSLKKKTAHIC